MVRNTSKEKSEETRVLAYIRTKANRAYIKIDLSRYLSLERAVPRPCNNISNQLNGQLY